jgi:hypothetical protein
VVYLVRAVAVTGLEEKGILALEEYLAHTSPFHWLHVIFFG